jgi:tRNA (mo5U34)-methyltransferase
MTNEEIIKKANSLRWYHSIELLPGYFTTNYCPGTKLWDMIRSIRKDINYSGKSVIDLGTCDGAWGFEAEGLGATEIVGIDTWIDQPGIMEQAQWAAGIKKSKMEFRHIDVHQVADLTTPKQFDVIQNLGLLYHVEDPMLTLRQTRRACAKGGVMLLETAYWHNNDPAPMMRSNGDGGVYSGDATTIWAPNPACLAWMLQATGWGPALHTATLDMSPINRCCCIVKAT